jgi:arylsulfatase A-like enzyme
MAKETESGISRRRFLEGAAAVTAGIAAGQRSGARLVGSARAAEPPVAPRTNGKGGPRAGHNILFVFTDQERYFPKLPPRLTLPGHERLQKTGVTFHNHYCAATMCTSSRSVLMTGLQTQVNRMFDNVDMPWVKSLSTDIPTIGHMLRKAGYYTAYKGKWHLNRDFDVKEPDRLFTKEMERYGFADFFTPGDIIGHTLGGYYFDHLISGSARTWVRRKGRPLNDAGKPWALFVSLVNPHDIMFFNTDAPGRDVQDTGRLIMHAARAPEHELYEATWDAPLPKTLAEPLDAPSRPRAHQEYEKVFGYVLGEIPPEEERWRRYNDYYLNCLRAVDLEIASLLAELDELRVAERTIVVVTSDHGEMAGAHGMRGKGPFAYEEAMHLPFYVIHPDVRGGQDCRALTGHMDVVPTLLAMAGAGPGKNGEIAGRELAGKNLLPLLDGPGAAGVHAARDSVLFTWSGLGMNDAGLWQRVAAARAAGKNPAVALLKEGYVPDLKKRGSLRTVFDGRYKFSRYFAPLDHNRPETLDELYGANDVELFDLEQDPAETKNLAADREANGELITAMIAKLEAIIKAEIGIDDGRELPKIPLVTWTIDRADL